MLGMVKIVKDIHKVGEKVINEVVEVEKIL